VLLHHYMGEVDSHAGSWGFARGGMGAITQALSKSLQASGGKVMVDAGVEEILVSGGRARGVRLESGEELLAPVVVSNLDVKRTFLKVMKEEHLPEDFVTRVRNFRIRGSSAKLNMAFDGVPDLALDPAGSPVLKGDLHYSESLDEVERAYDDWKDGRWSTCPTST
jgi:phytoene dehydrogenase-like protein